MFIGLKAIANVLMDKETERQMMLYTTKNTKK